MGFACLTKQGEVFSRNEMELDDFLLLKTELYEAQRTLQKYSIKNIVDLLNDFSRLIIKDPRTKEIEGIGFLSNWIRKSNIERIIKLNFENPNILEQFVGKGKKRLRAQPRGLICHWIAGNVPTLALFSLFQSILLRNANLIRIPSQSFDNIKNLLEVFKEIKKDDYSGYLILKSIAIIHFPSSDKILNEKMSQIADARVVWGGSEAVKAIQGLSHSEHCEDLIFGPKYSFAVIDKKTVQDKSLEMIIRKFSNDIVTFEQSACSSPHVFFYEKPYANYDLKSIGTTFARYLSKLSESHPKQYISQSKSTQIINIRADYALSQDKDLLCSKSNDWTILMDNNLNLEEPIQSRTIWLKPVKSLLDVIPLITKKIQTIGVAISDKSLFTEFVREATYRGVARCVAPGQMNFYDVPWDGMMMMNRLVNICTIVKLDN